MKKEFSASPFARQGCFKLEETQATSLNEEQREGNLYDPEFGTLTLVPSPRARRCVFRVDADGTLRVSVPPRMRKPDALRALEQMRPRLRSFVKRVQARREQGRGLVAQALAERGIADEMATLRKRLNTRLMASDLTESQLNHLLLQNVLRRRAHQTFPVRLAELARQHGFTYTSVRITSSHSRWGSCSVRGNINLSLWLALLPPHLQDFTMLHELCHTRHMNHSPQFWALLNEVTNGRCATLRREQAQWTLENL